MKQHSWTGITHHCPHTFAHVRIVAVNGAFAACRLVISMRTTTQSEVRILQQFTTIAAKTFIALLMSAINLHHFGNHAFLSLNPGHINDLSIVTDAHTDVS